MGSVRTLRTLLPRAAVILLTVAGPDVLAATVLDLDRAPDPAALCRALALEGMDLGSLWQESRAIRGGWVCARADGTDGSEGVNGLSYRVLGSGPNKIDRLILRLDLGDALGAQDARVTLARAGERLAAALGMKLSPQLMGRIEAERLSSRADWRPTAADSGRRLVFEERQGWTRIRLSAEQSTQAALILSFDNPNASGLWR